MAEEPQFDKIELEMALNAYNNAETPEEAFDVVTFISGAESREQAIINLCLNATSHSIRSALAAILVGWLEDGYTAEVLTTLNSIAQHDYKHMLEDAGLLEKEDEDDE